MNQQANPSSENNISPSSPNDMPDLMQVDNSSSSPPSELDQGEVASSGVNDAKSDRKKKVTNKEGDSKIISHSRGKGSRAASSGKKLIKKKGRPKNDADIPGLPSLPPLPPPQPFAAATKTSKRSSDCLSTADGELKDENQPSSKLAKLDNSSAQNEEKKKEMNHSSDSAAATGGKENENRTTETENASLTVSAKKQLTDGSQDKDSQLIPSMSAAAIEQHLDSLISIGQLTPRRIARKCLPLVRKLRNHEFGWVFREPVDPVELGIPDYFDIVEHPMDLALVEKKLENGVYKDFDSFERETKLVFQNAILFNGASSDVGEMANSLLELFEEDLKIVMKGR